MAAKINMRLDKNEMPSQDPNVRNKNFLEVALGYTEEQALDEAARCLNCKNHPCVDGCPVNVRIPEFIAKIVEKDYEGAYQVIHQTSSLPAVCGRVCPQESQCEMHCVRGKKGDPVGIGRLERFVADWHNAHSTEAAAKPAPNGHKVAVIGSGPAGLTCAGDLAKKGYEVTVFEALHLAGGVLVYGIPEFRLPKAIVQKEVDGLKAMGVKVETNTVVGRTITIDELMEENGFEAVFIGSGAGLPMFMNIPGENLKGVYSANEFLTRINLMKAYREDSDTPIMDLKGKTVAAIRLIGFFKRKTSNNENPSPHNSIRRCNQTSSTVTELLFQLASRSSINTLSSLAALPSSFCCAKASALIRIISSARMIHQSLSLLELPIPLFIPNFTLVYLINFIFTSSISNVEISFPIAEPQLSPDNASDFRFSSTHHCLRTSDVDIFL